MEILAFLIPLLNNLINELIDESSKMFSTSNSLATFITVSVWQLYSNLMSLLFFISNNWNISINLFSLTNINSIPSTSSDIVKFIIFSLEMQSPVQLCSGRKKWCKRHSLAEYRVLLGDKHDIISDLRQLSLTSKNNSGIKPLNIFS